MRRDTLVLETTGRRWTLTRPSLADRLLIRWRARRLNAQLAEGLPVESDRHRAMRADLLVAPTTRADLAACWQTVLDRAARSRTAYDPRVPVVRPKVLAASSDIRALIEALCTPGPVPARGVAMADVLISDSTGPLYSGRSPQDLRATIQTAVHNLNPAETLEAELQSF